MSTIIYNAQGLFVGPSGANFQSYTGGEPVFDYSDPAATENLIKQIDFANSPNFGSPKQAQALRLSDPIWL